MPHTTPMPGDAAPNLAVDRLGGDAFDLNRAAIDNHLILLFYRGVHCPICKGMLEELNGRMSDFERIGVGVVPLSMDSRERAEKQRSEWDIGRLSIGYGMSEETARAFGLFISRKEQEKEPERFSEPGVAIIKPDRSIYALFIQSVPFTRPSFDGLINGLKFVQDKGYPVRGTLAA